LKAGGSQEVRPPVGLERPVGLGSMGVQAVLRLLPFCQHLRHSGHSFVGLNDVEDGFEEP
jgi:hypothetical protein